jgi:hypothetical protein
VTDYSHSEIEELLGAYSLDAVEPEEREAIEAHLAECPRCRAEVADLREVAALLANNDDEAPEGVWDRIAAAIEDVPPPMRLDVRRHPARGYAAGALAVAAAVAILVLGWQVHDLRDQNDGIEKQLAAASDTRSALSEANVAMLDPNSRLARLTGSNGQHALAVVTEKGQGYLLASDLPALDSGIYELWGQDASGALVALGSMEQPGIARFTAGDDVTKLLMTVEPVFAQQPTTQPIMQGVVV